MKISPLFLLLGLGLGLIVLPETIIHVPIFPFGRADAAIVPLNNDIPAEYINATAQNNISAVGGRYPHADTTQHNQSDTTNPHLSSGASAVGGRYPQRSPLECAACEYLANGLNQTVLHNPKVIAFITTDIEKVCSVLPESVQAMCNNAAQSVAPMLLDHLGDFIVTEGCQDLGVCHSSIIA
jgi:hypothetical protein